MSHLLIHTIALLLFVYGSSSQILISNRILGSGGCDQNEVYLTNGSLVLCVAEDTGKLRTVFNLARGQANDAGAVVAVNDLLLFPGWVNMFQMAVVEYNVNTWDVPNITGPGPELVEGDIGWNDIAYNYTSNEVYGFEIWNNMGYIFKYPMTNNAAFEWAANFSICEMCSKSVMSASPMSAIAGGNFYTLLSVMGYGAATLYMVNLENGGVRGFMNTEFDSVIAMYYNPLDDRLYACAVKSNVTYVKQTSIIRINPESGDFKTVSVLTKAPSGPTSTADSKSPMFVAFNFGTSKAYLFYTNETDNNNHMQDISALYTFDIESGDLLSRVPLYLHTLSESWVWMMATMNYFQ